MQSAENWPAEQLVGRQITFNNGPGHADCWHFRVGLTTGKVLRVGQTLAQKAETMISEGFPAPQEMDEPEEEPRIWIKADPCGSFPRGCEVAVPKECLLISDPTGV